MYSAIPDQSEVADLMRSSCLHEGAASTAPGSPDAEGEEAEEQQVMKNCTEYLGRNALIRHPSDHQLHGPIKMGEERLGREAICFHEEAASAVPVVSLWRATKLKCKPWSESVAGRGGGVGLLLEMSHSTRNRALLHYSFAYGTLLFVCMMVHSHAYTLTLNSLCSAMNLGSISHTRCFTRHCAQ
jgi:hypothetical protein